MVHLSTDSTYPNSKHLLAT